MQEIGWVTQPTLDWLEAFIKRRSTSHEQAGLLKLVIEEGRRQASRRPNGLPPAEIPAAVYGAAGGGDVPLPIAAACLCLYLGADVLDNVVDRELSDLWETPGPAAAILASVTVGSPLALTCLQEIDGPIERRHEAQRLLIDAMIDMSAGQIADVAFESREDVSLEACEAMVVAKSGAECALFARLGALVAGAPSSVCEAYATFGRELGTAVQLTSDCADLVEGGEARDLASGKRTLPIAHALSNLSSPARSQLLEHLTAAKHNHERRQFARRILLDAGSFQYGALIAEVHRQRALAALRSADPREPHAGVLFGMLQDLALGMAQSGAAPVSGADSQVHAYPDLDSTALHDIGRRA